MDESAGEYERRLGCSGAKDAEILHGSGAHAVTGGAAMPTTPGNGQGRQNSFYSAEKELS
jgi:hypothetical protein